MDERYHIYFAGQVSAGEDPGTVRARLGKLFNADAATLDKLFSGQAQLLKRDCDKATALRYKQALEQAGAVPLIRAVGSAVGENRPAPAKPMTAAEKIAALAAAPDVGRPAGPGATPPPQDEDAAAAGGIRLSPAGTAVLLPAERAAPAVSSVEVPSLEVYASGQRLSDPAPQAPPPPDTSHLSEGPVGELLPNLPAAMQPVAPDISDIALAPDGTDLSDCAAAPAAPPALDLSGMELAPAGADVLESKYRRKDDIPAPSTDHLALED